MVWYIDDMDKDTLLRRKAAIEQSFDEFSKQKTDIETEMTRLQGEHRLVISLLDDSQNVMQATDAIKKPKRIRKVVVQDAETQQD